MKKYLEDLLILAMTPFDLLDTALAWISVGVHEVGHALAYKTLAYKASWSEITIGIGVRKLAPDEKRLFVLGRNGHHGICQYQNYDALSPARKMLVTSGGIIANALAAILAALLMVALILSSDTLSDAEVFGLAIVPVLFFYTNLMGLFSSFTDKKPGSDLSRLKHLARQRKIEAYQ